MDTCLFHGIGPNDADPPRLEVFLGRTQSPQRQLGLEAVRSVVAGEEHENVVDMTEEDLELDRRHGVDFRCRFIPRVFGNISK